jgi:hypothetical protein
MNEERLAAAIIEQAAVDMGKALRRIQVIERKMRYIRHNLYDARAELQLEPLQDDFKKAKAEYQEAERYILSDWCEVHCELAGINHSALKDGIEKLMK